MNGNDSAHPTVATDAMRDQNGDVQYHGQEEGFTKREAIAVAVYPEMLRIHGQRDYSTAAREAWIAADALIAASGVTK